MLDPTGSASISTLVSELPEVYQPIFGHNEFSENASRLCEDRFLLIKNAYLFLSAREGRPLKVLDLGCAQGFFSLSLASLGATVTGIDYSQPNITVCQKLADENPQLKVDFKLQSIDAVVQSLFESEYDLVLGLSVFHHVIHEHGIDYVKSLFDIISSHIPSGFFEFALREEPLYWAESQPEQPYALLRGYAFSHKISMHGTHLSDIKRPIYFASNKYWLIEEHGGEIDSLKLSSHDFEKNFHQESRRYYFSDDLLVKIFRLGADVESRNRLEYQRELDFLSAPPPGFDAPRLVAFGENNEETWLVRQIIPGTLLSERLLDAPFTIDAELVTNDLLFQLSALERAGKYHSDVRPWNVIVDDDGHAFLIDYGAISSHPEDADDLYGQILSFLYLAREISERKLRDSNSQRPPFVSPAHHSGHFERWMRAIWLIPSYKWTFGLLASLFKESKSDSFELDSKSDWKLISGVLESFLSTFSNQVTYNFRQLHTAEENSSAQLKQALGVATQAQAQAHAAEVSFSAQLKRALDVAAQAQAQAHAAEARTTQAEVELEEARQNLARMHQVNQEISKREQQERNHVQALLGSTSWRITAPLRAVSQSIPPTAGLLDVLHNALNESKSRVYRLGVIVLKRLAGYAHRSPRFKRVALKILSFSPRLSMKLRRIYLQSSYSRDSGYVDSSFDIEPLTRDAVITTSEYNNPPAAEGLNARLRTPLERYFHARKVEK